MDPNTPSIQRIPPDLYPGYFPPRDLADGVKGMYRVLELISESGSNGNGKGPINYIRDNLVGFEKLICEPQSS